MTEAMAKIKLERVFKDRDMAVNFPCPRCGYDTMNKDTHRNALSRYADVLICDECGTSEALCDYFGTPWKLTDWAAMALFR